MVVTGFLTTMNVWADSMNDIRFSLNDVYMSLLMTGWMFLFMGLFYKEHNIFLIGILLIISMLWCIRTQFMISEKQYFLGMIPHHSMAVHMSKKLLEKEEKKENKNTDIMSFIKNIIKTQSNEIDYMKEKTV